MTAELRHLRAFLAIADAGSVTSAAAMLRMSQPALSRTLRQLEDHMGARLVDRTTHRLELTTEGRHFRDKAAGAVAAVDEALDPARLRPWPLRLGHAWSAFGRHTTPLLRRWKETFPQTPLELLRVDERTAGLLSGKTDVALVRAPLLPREAEGLLGEWLCNEQRVAAVPADSELAAHTGPLNLAALVHHPIALNTVSGVTTLDLWPEELRPSPDTAVLVANTDDWLGAIAAGDAVGVSTTATAEMHPHPDVVYRPLAGAGDVPLMLVWREVPMGSGQPSHPAVPQLVRVALEVLAEDEGRTDAPRGTR
ncbi:LysR family transcriptional regulator [Streptomyces nanshensis]|uniref:LysR family transcriptional regulator n=1 Tax=Streptomyces nanshensis TaxID=518642 RepID=A0A1E7KSA4_9ACTN|nr:LysR family transcriptional regulator [Streptomyces nanshensis]OEV06797.1 LysR family transcriptional regulator [Streptomyces nanshensis]